MNRAAILDSLSIPSFKHALLVSVAAHALFLVVALRQAGGSSDLPSGVRRLGDPTILEIGLDPQTKKSKTRVHQSQVATAASSSDVVIKKHEEVGSEAPGRFGLRDGTATEGRMGVRNGTAASEKERYLYELRVLLEGRKVYPRISRSMRETGKVLVRFTIRQDGRIEAVQIVKASAYDRLNQAASELVSGLQKYKPFPEGVEAASLSIEVPLEYRLN